MEAWNCIHEILSNFLFYFIKIKARLTFLAIVSIFLEELPQFLLYKIQFLYKNIFSLNLSKATRWNRIWFLCVSMLIHKRDITGARPRSGNFYSLFLYEIEIFRGSDFMSRTTQKKRQPNENLLCSIMQ